MGIRTLTPRTVYRVPINSAATAITLAEKVEGKKLSLIWLVFSVSGAGDVQLLGDTTELGILQFASAGDKATLENNTDGWVETDFFQDLKLGNASALTIKGFAGYVEI